LHIGRRLKATVLLCMILASMLSFIQFTAKVKADGSQTLIFQVSADVDDCEYTSSSVTSSQSEDRVGNYFGSKNMAVRFAGVNIPQGSTILSANLSLYSTTSSRPYPDDAVDIQIVGILEPNTADFSTNPYDRPETNAYLNISQVFAGGQWYTFNITQIIQEIVNQADWQSGNAIGIKIKDNGSATYRFVYFQDYYGDSTKAAKLEISFVPNAEIVFSNAAYSDDTPYALCTFSIYAEGIKGNISEWIFSHNRTGTWQNESAKIFIPPVQSAWLNYTKLLNGTVGQVVGYKWYVKSTNDVWVSTGTYTLTIHEDIRLLKCLNYTETETGWSTSGSSPYIDEADDGSYIYTTTIGANSSYYVYGNLSDAAMIKGEVQMHIIYNSTVSSSTQAAYVYFKNGTVDQKLCILNGTNGELEHLTLNLTLIPNWTPYRWNSLKMKLKFESLTANYIMIDQVYFNITVWKQSRILAWLWQKTIERQVNATFPWVRRYDELNHQFTNESYAEYAGGIFVYQLIPDDWFLEKVYEFYDYVEQTSIDNFLWDKYVNGSGWDENYAVSPREVARKMLSIVNLACINASYKPLAKQVVNKVINFWLPDRPDSYLSCYVYRNGTHGDTIAARKQGFFAGALAYAGAKLQNETIKEIAVKAALAYPLVSNTSLPRHVINRTTLEGYGAYADLCKEDGTLGQYMLGLEMVYYYTKNETVKERIKKLADAAVKYQFYHNLEDDTYYFVYTVYVETGEVHWDDPVHGFGYIDEAMTVAYLIFGNETYLDRALKDYSTIVIQEKYLLEKDLIKHSPNAYDSCDYWSRAAKRIAVIFYCLNYSLTYHNRTYIWDGYAKLFSASARARMKNYGWATGVDVRTSEVSNLYKIYRYDMEPYTWFYNFLNVTDATINTLTDYYVNFGNPITGEAAGIAAVTVGSNSTKPSTPCNFYAFWQSKKKLSKAFFYWNASGTMELNGTYSFPEDTTEGWSNFTRTLPNQHSIVIAWYIVCNDSINNWGSTDIQYLQLGVLYEVPLDLNVTVEFYGGFGGCYHRLLSFGVQPNFSFSSMTDYTVEALLPVNPSFSTDLDWNSAVSIVFQPVLGFDLDSVWNAKASCVFNVPFSFAVEAFKGVFLALQWTISPVFTVDTGCSFHTAIPFNFDVSFSSVDLQSTFNVALNMPVIVDLILDVSVGAITHYVNLIFNVNPVFNNIVNAMFHNIFSVNIPVEFSSSQSWNATVPFILNVPADFYVAAAKGTAHIIVLSLNIILNLLMSMTVTYGPSPGPQPVIPYVPPQPTPQPSPGPALAIPYYSMFGVLLIIGLVAAASVYGSMRSKPKISAGRKAFASRKLRRLSLPKWLRRETRLIARKVGSTLKLPSWPKTSGKMPKWPKKKKRKGAKIKKKRIWD